jgi:hypothetical protein
VVTYSRLTALAAVMLLVCASSVVAAPRAPVNKSAPWATDGAQAGPVFTQPLTNGTFLTSGQHGAPGQHIPAVNENMQVVGKLELSTPPEYRFDPSPVPPALPTPDPSQPALVPGQIADLAVYKNFAYLNSWSEPSCMRGGFFVADISNPSSPQQVAFVPALPSTYHGEGAHAITINTPAFKGDVLAVNNESCQRLGQPVGSGGFDLYDVSDPRNPKILVQGAGDQSPDEPLDSPFADTTQDPNEVPNSAHSVFIWQDGPRAYAVIVDNTEVHDVDIFDITDPRNPVFIADIDLVLLGEAQGKDIVANSANGDTIFHHDMIVKEINGVQTMLVSYWDAGYVKLNVDNPANPVIIGDSDFDDQDPLVTDPDTGVGFERPEGNGHQAEFSHDNQFVLAADEDFATYRTDFEITSGPNAGPYESGEFGFTLPIASLPDQRLNGPTVYGGYGCDADDQIPAADTAIPPASLAAGEEQIVVLQRGPVADPSAPYPGCRFDEKLQNALDKGYEGAIIANHHNGAGNGAFPDAAFCGSGDPRAIRGMCIGHRAFHLLFNDPPDYDPDYTPNSEPAVGTVGEDVAATAQFGGGPLRHRGGHRRALRVRLRGPVGARVRDRLDGVPRLQLVLLGRHAGVPLRERRARAGRQVRRRRRQQLLGRRAVHDAAGRPPDRRLRPRLRPLPVPLHGTGCGPEAGLLRRDRDGPVQGRRERPADVLGRERQPADGVDRVRTVRRHPER